MGKLFRLRRPIVINILEPSSKESSPIHMVAPTGSYRSDTVDIVSRVSTSEPVFMGSPSSTVERTRQTILQPPQHVSFRWVWHLSIRPVCPNQASGFDWDVGFGFEIGFCCGFSLGGFVHS